MSEYPHPSEFVLEELVARGWTRTDLLGYTVGAVERAATVNMLNGHDPITVAVARILALAFGTSVALWLGLQASYDSQEKT